MSDHGIGSSHKKLLPAIVLVTLLTLAVVILVYVNATLEPGALPIGTMAPGLALTDNAGGAVQLESLRGARCAFLFFTAGCPHCRRVLSILNRLDAMFKDSLRIVYISLSGRDPTEQLIREEHFGGPILFAKPSEAKATFRIATVPALFLVDERGILLDVEFGVRSFNATERLLRDFVTNRLLKSLL